ncbi:MAG: sulfurtransferase [bacterium]|nr:sulfurtransferase [bacterium]MDE0600352.1 sulfurtransferase [bacterium]
MALIAAEALAGRLADPQTVIGDVRWYLADPHQGRVEYERGHLPGARFVDLDTDLSVAEGPGRHPLPPVAVFCRTLGRMGIGPDHTVVAYDSSGGAIAARLWWMLDSIGHRSAFVLDGGYQAWVEEGLPITASVPQPSPVDYPTSQEWRGVVNGDQVRSFLGRRTILDARSEDRYRGENETVDPRAGHIPTARSAFFGKNLTPGGRFLPPESLRLRYRELGVGESDTPVAYCGSGVTACHNLLALRLAGIPGDLYEGSWSDWSSSSDPLVATGPRPGDAPPD